MTPLRFGIGMARLGALTPLGALALLLASCAAQAPPAAPQAAGPAPAAAVAPVVPAAQPANPYAYLWDAGPQAPGARPRPAARSAAEAPQGAPAAPTASPEAGPAPATERPADAVPRPPVAHADDSRRAPDDAAPNARWADPLAPYLEGVASWYGPNFHGKQTANGEVYNQYGLTAAHPVLPIGTRVQVENLNNGRKVWLRINDRGPYAKGRVLDLTRIAAERLGMIEAGTAPVRITVLKWPETLAAGLGLRAYQQYVVQVAAYPDEPAAEEARARMQARFPSAALMLDPVSNGFLAVVAGPFEDEADARRLAKDMQQQGVTSLVRRYRN